MNVFGPLWKVKHDRNPGKLNEKVLSGLMLERFELVKSSEYPPVHQNCVVFHQKNDIRGVFRWSSCECVGA